MPDDIMREFERVAAAADDETAEAELFINEVVAAMTAPLKQKMVSQILTEALVERQQRQRGLPAPTPTAVQRWIGRLQPNPDRFLGRLERALRETLYKEILGGVVDKC
jgi:hypothetical protein